MQKPSPYCRRPPNRGADLRHRSLISLGRVFFQQLSGSVPGSGVLDNFRGWGKVLFFSSYIAIIMLYVYSCYLFLEILLSFIRWFVGVGSCVCVAFVGLSDLRSQL